MSGTVWCCWHGRQLQAPMWAAHLSVPADPHPSCLQLVPGLRVTGFKKSANEAVWVNAEIVSKRAAKHPRDKCHCRWVSAVELFPSCCRWAMVLHSAAACGGQRLCATGSCCCCSCPCASSLLCPASMPSFSFAASRCGGWTARMRARCPSCRCRAAAAAAARILRSTFCNALALLRCFLCWPDMPHLPVLASHSAC